MLLATTMGGSGSEGPRPTREGACMLGGCIILCRVCPVFFFLFVWFVLGFLVSHRSGHTGPLPTQNPQP